MIHRPFAVASVISLLLCAAIIAASWAGFRITWGHLSFSSGKGFYSIESDRVFDHSPLLYLDWLNLAICLGFLWIFFMLGWALARRAGGDSTAICRCPACSYNLTGNTSGVCPECGTSVEAKA
ncbi:MAG TPA: hypothetical protein VK797_30755 [Tepidisphaeraceae bacterium]|nr:hypothetical protein [Tepidisphaeraceae bacterium]